MNTFTPLPPPPGTELRLIRKEKSDIYMTKPEILSRLYTKWTKTAVYQL
jgi:hypothetical protein